MSNKLEQVANLQVLLVVHALPVDATVNKSWSIVAHIPGPENAPFKIGRSISHNNVAQGTGKHLNPTVY